MKNDKEYSMLDCGTFNSFVARTVSGGVVSLIMIPVMILLPVLVGAVIGLIAGILLKRTSEKKSSLEVLIMGITVTVAVGYWLNTKVFTGIVCSVLQTGKPEFAVIVKGTIAAEI